MKRTLIPMILLGLLMIITGCGSDSMAPQDPMPALGDQASAQQAGLVAYAVAAVGPLAVTYAGKSEDVYTFTGGDITGSVQLDFRANGTPSTPAEADFVEITTLGESGLTITTPFGGQTHISAHILSDIDRVQDGVDSATIREGSEGSLDTGFYHADFTIGAVTVYETGYPTGGPVVFDNGYHVVTFSFDGTHLAEISLDDHVRWTFDLDTMDLAEVD